MHVCQYGISGIRRAGVCVCVEGGGGVIHIRGKYKLHLSHLMLCTGTQMTTP